MSDSGESPGVIGGTLITISGLLITMLSCGAGTGELAGIGIAVMLVGIGVFVSGRLTG